MGEDRHGCSMIDAPADAPPLAPPAIVAPAPREVSFGLVAGTAPRGTRRVIVRVGERVARRPAVARHAASRCASSCRGATFAVRVTAVDGAGRGRPASSRTSAAFPSARSRAQALVAPGSGARPLHPHAHARGQAARARCTSRTSQRLRGRLERGRTLSGRLDAQARDRPHRPPLRDRKPALGTRVDRLLGEMLIHSDNASANELEVWLAARRRPARRASTRRCGRSG